jgi:hypothetical protein
MKMKMKQRCKMEICSPDAQPFAILVEISDNYQQMTRFLLVLLRNLSRVGRNKIGKLTRRIFSNPFLQEKFNLQH